MRIALRPSALVVALTITFTIFVSASSNTATIKGRLFKNGAPLSKYTVGLKKPCKCTQCETDCSCCPDQINVSTDDNGFFEAKVPAGTYDAIIDGQKKGKVQAPAGKTTNMQLDISKP